MRIRINERRVGVVQRVNNNKERQFCYFAVENVRSYGVATSCERLPSSSTCYHLYWLLSSHPSALWSEQQAMDITMLWSKKLDMWSYLGGPLWYCWLHCKSHPRLHPTWSQVKSHYPINGNQVLRRVMSRYMSIHSSHVRTWITISAAENVWKGSATYW